MADMNSSVGKVFAYILDHKDTTPKDIAKALKMNPNTVSAACSELFKMEFVIREMHQTDKGKATFAYRAAKTMEEATNAPHLTPAKNAYPSSRRPRVGRNGKAIGVLVTVPLGKKESATMTMEEFIGLYREMRDLAKTFGVRDE